MKIAFFTEMEFQGKIPRNHPNMRVEFAWMCALEADHYNIKSPLLEKYDLGIVIIPKKNPDFNIDDLKLNCKKVAVMQEGPNWYWQDYDLSKQIWYYNTLTSSDIIFTHNEIDKKYYQGLTDHHDVRVLQSLMIEDAIGEVQNVERKGVIIGGNFVSWYGGFDSFSIAQEMDNGQVYAPSMGRRQSNEEQLLTHLPYLDWKQWIHTLNQFKYGIHLMRTHAAGTFALNCSYLGIPCIGYEGLDTQHILHPNLTVELGDLQTARKIALKLKNNLDFYQEQSILTKQLYQEKYHENIFNPTFKKQFKIS
jgi:hypothetical protein